VYARDDLWGFIVGNDGYNVLYPVLGSFFTMFGVTPLNVEIVLPPILTFILIIEITRNLSFLASGTALHVRILTTLSWFALFRISGDLHANLLSLIFSFQALYSLSKYYENQRIRSLATAIVSFFLSSLTHIETALFFALITAVGSTLSQGLRKATETTALIASVITPALVLYYRHISLIASYSGGVMAGNVLMSIQSWFTYFGLLGLFSIPGLYYATSKFKEKSFLSVATLIWALLSIALGLLQYAHPSFGIFGERALMLYPAPFLAQLTLSKLRVPPSLKRHWKKILTSALVMMAVTTFSYTSYSTYRVFLPSSTYQKLLWLRENYGDRNLILIVDDFDEYAGIKGDLFDNWVKAIFGIKSHVYLGNLYYLHQKTSTPYFNPVSTQISNWLFSATSKEIEDLNETTVVYMEDLNNPPVPPTYYLEVMENIRIGVYAVNITDLSGIDNVIRVPLYRANTLEGDFYSVQRDWSESRYALELWEPENTGSNCSCQLKFKSEKSGIYDIHVRYWDADIGTSPSLTFNIDNENVCNLDYSGLAEPKVAAVFKGFLEVGEHILTIQVGRHSLYASMDYVEIRLIAINETGY
jgi:hypothetical protein